MQPSPELALVTITLNSAGDKTAVFSYEGAQLSAAVLTDGSDEYFELRTKQEGAWSVEYVIKHGDPLCWNFGDGTGDVVGNYVKHDYRGLQGWKTITVKAVDGIQQLQRLRLTHCTIDS